jgi:anaerobic magnesium-protoporphyrin IX monomethyl ester cyclase
MKVILMSMPDVTPIIIHETAVHMPGHGIACVGANIDPQHEVYIVDLIRKRRKVRAYVEKLLRKYKPDLVGLSAMAWQYDTCTRIAKVIRACRPETKIVIGGYHATLMYDEIAASKEGALFDYMVRGEGEIVTRRLVNALAGEDEVGDIPGLSWRGADGGFVHNEWQGPLDLSQPLNLPIRDKRRLTWGYHILYFKIELLETSRGCTRGCNFCSMRHMYGRSFRTYPIERVLADLDDIYYQRKCRWVFIVDDNMVLSPKRVMALCDAIIARGYRKLNLVVQADCISMSQNEDMVAKMAQAGFRSVFLGIESASTKNLDAAGKGNIVSASKAAVAMCHKYGIMVIGGLIFGFPDDEETDIIANYQFLKDIDADASYCQILTPYPKTGMREDLINQGLVTNKANYKKYSGLWANVKTRHLTSEKLQYLFWLHRQKTLGFWKPSGRARSQGRGWTAIWIYIMKPLLKSFYARIVKRDGWEGRYGRELKRLERMNSFPDLKDV